MVVLTGQGGIVPHPNKRITYGEREIDLATQKWAWAVNIPKGEEERGLEFARNNATNNWKAPNFEVHIEDFAYNSMGKFFPNYSGIYIRGEPIQPRVERRVVLEAWDFLERSEITQLELLARVYQEVVVSNSGAYAHRLNQQQEGIVAILNYFADKIRRDDEKKAMRLELEISKRF